MVACQYGTQIPKLAMLALPQMHIPFGSFCTLSNGANWNSIMPSVFETNAHRFS